eukprot:66879-Ditylum_brightwellii.AAC.1
MECILKANDSAPQYLSCRLTNNGLTKICYVAGSNSKNTALALLDALLPDNIISNLDSYTKDDVEQVNKLIELIQCGNFVNDDEDTQLCIDSCVARMSVDTLEGMTPMSLLPSRIVRLPSAILATSTLNARCRLGAHANIMLILTTVP